MLMSDFDEVVLCGPLGQIVDKIVSDGIYRIQLEDGNVSIEILAKNFDIFHSEASVKNIVFSFAGAISGRAEKQPPFIELVGVVDKLAKRIPLVAFSDPSLRLSNKLNLAWYAGNKACPKLAIHIGKFIQALVDKYRVRPVLVGASGGGFAALKVMEALDDPEAQAFVWNPQTDISQYEPWAVKAYMEYCFGIDRPKSDDPEVLNELLATCGVDSFVKAKNIKGKVTYFINSRDKPHIFKHLKLFFDGCKIEKLNAHNFMSGNMLIHFELFGNGHAGPQKNVVVETLDDILAGKDHYMTRAVERSIGSPPLFIDLATNYELNPSRPVFFRQGDSVICFFNNSSYESYIPRWRVKVGEKEGTSKLGTDVKFFELPAGHDVEVFVYDLSIEGIFGSSKNFSGSIKISSLPIMSMIS